MIKNNFTKSHLSIIRSISTFLILILFSIAQCSKSYGAAKTFTGPGNFSDPTKWSGLLLPLVGDNLTLKGACTVDNSVLTDNIAYGTLVIGSGTACTLTWPVGGTNRLSVTNVTSSRAGSSLDMTNGGTLIIRGGTWSSANLAFTPGTGTIGIRAALTIPAAYTTFNNLVINGVGINVSIGAGTVVNSNLTVTAGTFTVGAFAFAVTGTTTITSTLSITSSTGAKSFGDLIVNGTFDNTSANVPITINGNLQNNGSFNQGTGRVTFAGAASNTVTGTAPTTAFGGGITVNKGTSTANILDVQCVITMVSGGLILTNGTLKISSASTITPFSVDIVPPPYLIPTNAGLWCNGAVINTPGGGMTWSVQGLFRISAGTVNAGSVTGNWFAPRQGATIIVEGGNFNLADRISQIGETWTFNMTGGTMTINTVGSNTANRAAFNMEQAGSSFSMSGGTMIIERQAGGAGENLGYYNIGTLGTGFTGGTLQIGDASTPAGQIMKITTTAPIYNLTVNSTNATAILNLYSITVSNNLTITSGILDANSLNITVGGNWNNSSAKPDPFVQGTGTVTFNGSSLQTLSTATASETFYDLLIANTNGGVSLSSVDVNVTNVLALESGMITTGANKVVVTGSSAGNLLSESGFVNGNLRRFIASNTGTYLFSVGTGTNSTDRHSLSFLNNSLTGVSYIDASVADFTQSAPNNDASLGTSQSGTTITNTAGTASGKTILWNLTANAAPSGGNFGIRLYVENTTLSSANDNGFSPLKRTNTTTFANFLTNDATTSIPSYDADGRIYDVGSGYAQRTGHTTFGQFAIGHTVGALPIELISFDAKALDNEVDVTWTTAAEINNDYFTVEKSSDNIDFISIAKVPGAGTSSVTLNYGIVDRMPYKGISYYRLRQTDFDGHESLSNTIAVNNDFKIDEIFIYPNPFNNSAIMRFETDTKAKNASLAIYSSSGNLIKVETSEISNNEIKIERNNLPDGLYFFELTIKNYVVGKGKFTIQQ